MLEPDAVPGERPPPMMNLPSVSAAGALLSSGEVPPLIVVAGNPERPEVQAFCKQVRSVDPDSRSLLLVATTDPVAESVRADLARIGIEVIQWARRDPAPARALLGVLLRHGSRSAVHSRRERALQKVLLERTSHLWEAEERYRILVQESPDGIVVLSPDGVILDANAAAQRLMGVSEESLVGRRWADLVQGSAAELLRELTSDSARRGAWQQTFVLTTAPAGPRIVDVVATIVTVEHQKAFLLYLRDVTEREQAEQERRRAEGRYRLLVESLPGITYIYDFAVHRTTYISPQLRTILGYDPTTWMADPNFWVECIHPDDRERVRHEVIDVHDVSHEPFALEYRVLGADGRQVWLYNVGAYLEVAPGQWILQGFMLDITDRRQAEEEARRGWARLAEMQKMEVVGRLAAGVAHDFNNALTTILGYGQLLQHDALMPESLKGDLGEILQAARRAEALVRELQSLSRSAPIQRMAVDVNEVVRGVDKVARRTLGKAVELAVVLEPQSCIAEVDPGRLSQALMNLVVRARDVVSSQGLVRISTSLAEAGPSDRELWPDLPGEHVVQITVEDTGPALSDEQLANIFEPFYRLPGDTETGLSLAVVRSLIEAMGGRVVARRREEGGTAFTITFPHRPDLAVARAEPAVSVQGGTERILVVDDEAGVRSLAARILRAAGYDVTEAANGIEALHRFEEAPERWDLVLTDIIMPGLSGPELLEQIRRRRPEVRALCMTGYAHEPFLNTQDQVRIPVIAKPFTRTTLLFAVRQVLDGVWTARSG